VLQGLRTRRDYPPTLDDILNRALAKNPADRYSTADGMAAEVASLADELKRGQVTDWIQRADRLVQEDQYTTAREGLLRLSKVDTQHTRARKLFAPCTFLISQHSALLLCLPGASCAVGFSA
jgi:uncharacterized protein HemY